MTTTTYLELDDQATGANNNTWGDVADANMAILEQAIARYVAIATTGGTTTLTSSQNRYPIIRLTGTLTSNATIEVKTQEKNWIFINATTGAYTVTVKTSAGTGKVIPQGRATKLYCDGTNVEDVKFHTIPTAQAGGTVDVITATFYPASTTGFIADGTLWIVEAAGANTTTTPTFNPDSTGALTIKKNGGQALLVGDIRAAGHKLLLCYDSSGGHVELLNPLNFPAATDAETETGTATDRFLTPANLTAKEATSAEWLANTADRILTTDIVYTGAAEVTLTDAVTIAVNMSTFINAKVTLAGNRVLGQPSNTKVGQAGFIRIIQDATGSRTLSYHADWKFVGGADPVLSTTGGTTDILFYQVVATNFIYASLVKAVA